MVLAPSRRSRALASSALLSKCHVKSLSHTTLPATETWAPKPWLESVLLPCGLHAQHNRAAVGQGGCLPPLAGAEATV